MGQGLFWLNHQQWKALRRYLPQGLTGPKRWPAHDDLQSLQSLVQAWPMAQALRGACQPWKGCGEAILGFDIDQSSPLRRWRKRGEHTQAIGHSRGGRTTKIHALSDPLCRPVAFHLTPGQEADIAAARDVLALAPPAKAIIADKGYDGDALRAEIKQRRARPIIPNKSNRVRRHRFDKRAYKGRNVIERCFCRLKDFRRIATRYDKLARNFLSAVHLAALIAFWLN